MPTRLSPLAATVALLAAAIATAQEPPHDPHAVQPERPTVATHAYTVAPGWIEIEAGMEFDRYADRARGVAAPIVIKMGLAPRLQLDLDGSLVRPPQGSATGLGDVALGLKWRVLMRAPVLGDFSVIPSLKVPSAPTASGLGTGTTDIGLLLISSHQLGPISMDLNVGYTRRSGPGTIAPRSGSVWTASFGGPAGGSLGWTAEVYGYPGTSGPAGQAPIVAFLGGPTLLVRPWLALDAGAIAPVTGPQPWALYLGGVINAGRLW
jgi:hypothetical protein